MDIKSKFQRSGPLDPTAQYEADVIGRVAGALLVQLPRHNGMQGLLPFRLMNDLEKYQFLKNPDALQSPQVQTAEVDTSTGRVVFKSVQIEPPSIARRNVSLILATLASETEGGFLVSAANVSGLIPKSNLENATIEALRLQLADDAQPKDVTVALVPGTDQEYRYHNTSTAATAHVADSIDVWEGRV